MDRALADALTVLAQAMIPADARDAGCAGVGAALAGGPNARLYEAGVRAAEAIAGRPLTDLGADELDALLGELRELEPTFFRQLRMDACALYLSDPAVLARIGFPGPSIEAGGYPDFDQPQGGAR